MMFLKIKLIKEEPFTFLFGAEVSRMIKHL